MTSTYSAILRPIVYIAFFIVNFVSTEIVYTISENAGKNFAIGQAITRSSLILKYNSSVIQRLEYSLMSRGSLPTDFFSINNRTSELKVAKPIDRDNLCDLLMICCVSETKCHIPLSIVVQPSSGRFFMEIIDVKIEILDENDNQPQFQSWKIQGHISEVAEIGSTVTLPDGNPLIATDRDSAANGIKKYSIISPTATFDLKVFEEYDVITDVSIVSRKELDRERTGSYTVVVMAEDGGKPPKSGSVTVEISVDDFNDHAPKFVNESYSVWLSETAVVNTFVVRVEALDKDSGPNGDVTYSIRNLPSDIVSRLFTINPNTGEIRTKGRLNFEERSTYRIHIEAKDNGAFLRRKSRTTLTVHLQDVNDHGPVIRVGYLNKADRAQAVESADIGTLVAFFIVTDPDDDRVNCVVDNPMFRLRQSITNSREFRLLTAHQLNREASDHYRVILTCTDQGSPQMSSTEKLTVHVMDDNDNPPIFAKSVYTTSLLENNELDIFVVEVEAQDLDTGENARVIYALDKVGEQMFTINSATGRIYTKRVFDREEEDQVNFKVLARDNGTKPLFAETLVLVTILDKNDNAPTFTSGNTCEISERAGAGVMLGHMSASDPDTGANAEIRFSLRPDDDSSSFAITNDGIITTIVQLDREKRSRYYLTVLARDRGHSVVHSSSTTVTIVVTDVNDNPPTIHFPNTYNNTIYISYLEPVGQLVVLINASDPDTGRNAVLDYNFTNGNEDKLFRLDRHTGAVRIAKALKKEDALVYKLNVKVTDQTEPFHTSTEILNIVVDGTGKAITQDGVYIDSIANNRNLIIVICLAGISAILAIVLVVAIVCIRRADSEQHNLYNVQTETQVIYEQRLSPLANKEYNKAPLRTDMPTEVEDTYHHVNGHHSPVYSSLRGQNWKSSVYPKAIGIGTKVLHMRHHSLLHKISSTERDKTVIAAAYTMGSHDSHTN